MTATITYTVTSPLTGRLYTFNTARAVGAVAFVTSNNGANEIWGTSATIKGAEKIARQHFSYLTKPRPSNTQALASDVQTVVVAMGAA